MSPRVPGFVMAARVAAVTVVAVALVLAAGCGDDDSVTAPDGSVAITTPDGEVLHAELVSPDADGTGPAVVLAHQRGADLHSWDPVIERLTGDGYTVLAFDFRGYGDSTGARDTALDVDLRAAIDHVASLGHDHIAVVGASMGGTAAVVEAAAGGVDLLVTLSAPAEFLGLDARAAAPTVDVPWLVVSAADDLPYADDAAGFAGAAPDARLVVVGGRTHGAGLFDDHPELYDELEGLLPS